MSVQEVAAKLGRPLEKPSLITEEPKELVDLFLQITFTASRPETGGGARHTEIGPHNQPIAFRRGRQGIREST